MPIGTKKPSDIAARVATKLKGTHAQGNEALNAVLDGIVEALKDGRTVTLTGFGTFEVRAIKPRARPDVADAVEPHERRRFWQNVEA